MKRILLLSVLFLAAAIGNAAANCTDNRITGAAINTLLNGKLVCGRPAAGYTGSPNDRWQEEHISGGALFDYKKGPTDKIDPRVQLGTWDRNGNTVRYVYDKYTPIVNVTYSGIFQVGTTGNTYSFCQGVSEIVRANVITSSTGCGGIFP